jgi:hypothetical protein
MLGVVLSRLPQASPAPLLILDLAAPPFCIVGAGLLDQRQTKGGREQPGEDPPPRGTVT